MVKLTHKKFFRKTKKISHRAKKISHRVKKFSHKAKKFSHRIKRSLKYSKIQRGGTFNLEEGKPHTQILVIKYVMSILKIDGSNLVKVVFKKLSINIHPDKVAIIINSDKVNFLTGSTNLKIKIEAQFKKLFTIANDIYQYYTNNTILHEHITTWNQIIQYLEDESKIKEPLTPLEKLKIKKYYETLFLIIDIIKFYEKKDNKDKLKEIEECLKLFNETTNTFENINKEFNKKKDKLVLEYYIDNPEAKAKETPIEKLAREEEEKLLREEEEEELAREASDDYLILQNKFKKGNLNKKFFFDFRQKEHIFYLYRNRLEYDNDKTEKTIIYIVNIQSVTIDPKNPNILIIETNDKDNKGYTLKHDSEKVIEIWSKKINEKKVEIKTREEREKQARVEAEKQARVEVEKQAREAAERKAKEEAAERKAREEAAKTTRLETEKQARLEAEKQARVEAAETTRLEVEKQAREAAERKAKEEAAERKAKEEAAERKAKEEAAEKQAREEAAEKQAREAAKTTRLEAEKQARLETERKEREEAAAKTAKLEVERKTEAAAAERKRVEEERKTRAAPPPPPKQNTKPEEKKKRKEAERQAREAKAEAERQSKNAANKNQTKLLKPKSICSLFS
jgi:hypothetical protein